MSFLALFPHYHQCDRKTWSHNSLLLFPDEAEFSPHLLASIGLMAYTGLLNMADIQGRRSRPRALSIPASFCLVRTNLTLCMLNP